MDTIIVRMQISNVLVVMYVLSSVYCELCQKNCHIGRTQGLRTADCYRKEITRVPQCLPRNTEVLELSFNRIREISEDDLKQYPYLQMLYLTDNKITLINEHALDSLTSLHTLDVSTNPFYKIPRALFSLPVLRKLSLGDIGNERMVKDIEDAVPIASPLAYVDLSLNKLSKLPVLGKLPSLKFYNVTGNTNLKLNTSMFAGLCNLQEFITEDCSFEFEDACECHLLEQWLTSRDVKFTSFRCLEKECSNKLSAEDLEVFYSCRKLHEIQQQQLYQKKLLTNVGISVGTIVIFLLFLLFFLFRRNKAVKQKKKVEKEAQKKQTEELIDCFSYVD